MQTNTVKCTRVPHVTRKHMAKHGPGKHAIDVLANLLMTVKYTNVLANWAMS